MFVDNGYYAGGDVGETHWLFVDKTGNILEVENDTVAVTAIYHNSDKVYFSLYADSSAANTLRNAAQQDAITLIDNWVKQKAKSGMDENTGQ